MSLRDWFPVGKKTSTSSPATGKKYELVQNQQVAIGSMTLYRIRALKDFGKVKAGELGGFIMSEKNLSQEGNCWVGENGQVFENARVYGDAMVGGHKPFTIARVYEDAQIGGHVQVCAGATVHGFAKFEGHQKINGGDVIIPPRTWKANFRIKHIYGLGDWR